MEETRQRGRPRRRRADEVEDNLNVLGYKDLAQKSQRLERMDQDFAERHGSQ
jgi:hypothetical protein